MKLTIRLVVAIMTGVFVLLTLDGILAVRREVTIFEEDMEHDARLVAHAVRTVLVDLVATGDLAGAHQLIDDINVHENTMRAYWLPSGEVRTPATGAEPPAASPRSVAGIHSEWRKSDTGSSVLVTQAPLVSPAGDSLGLLEIVEPRDALQRYVRVTVIRRIVLVLTLFVIATGAVFGLGITMVGRPLHRLMNATRRIGAGDLGTRVQLRGHDELSELAEALNAMAAALEVSGEQLQAETARRLATLEELRHADRLRTVGRLASGIAHELGTPLNVIAGRASMIAKRDLTGDDAVESAAIIRAQADRMTGIVRQLLDFARRPRTDRARVELGRVVSAVRSLVDPLARKAGVTVVAAEGEPAWTTGDPSQLEQVITNLVVNAIQASPSGAQVLVELGMTHAVPPPDHPHDPGVYAWLRVTDHGHGIAKDDVEHLFEPFFTTKDVGEGTGLGLSIVYSIVQDHGGWIDVTSDPATGTCFTIHLPGAPE